MSNYSFDTFGDVVDAAFDELTVDGDSNTFPGLTRARMEEWGNRYRKQFLSKINIKTQEGTDAFKTVADTTLADGTYSEGGTSLTITSSTGWPASGLCVVDGIPMTFTRSSTTLTVPALPRDFTAGDAVQLAYSVPTDFMRPRSIFISGRQYYLTRRGDSEFVKSRFVSLYGDYFVLPLNTAGSLDVTIHYIKKGSNSLSSSDTMDIMDLFDDYVIYKLTERGHRVMYDNDRAAEYKLLAAECLRDARSYFNSADASNVRMFMPLPDDDA